MEWWVESPASGFFKLNIALRFAAAVVSMSTGLNLGVSSHGSDVLLSLTLVLVSESLGMGLGIGRHLDGVGLGFLLGARGSEVGGFPMALPIDCLALLM